MIDHTGRVDSTVNRVLFIHTVGLLSRVSGLDFLCEMLMQWGTVLGIVLMWGQNEWYCCGVKSGLLKLIYFKGSTVMKAITRWSRFRKKKKKVLLEKVVILVFRSHRLLLSASRCVFAVFSGLKLSFHFSVTLCISPRAAWTVLVQSWNTTCVRTCFC